MRVKLVDSYACQMPIDHIHFTMEDRFAIDVQALDQLTSNGTACMERMQYCGCSAAMIKGKTRHEPRPASLLFVHTVKLPIKTK